MMRKASKATTVAVAAIAMAIGAAASPMAALAKKTTISWYIGNMSQHGGIWKDVAAMYEKANPGVTVKVLTGDVADKFYTMITAGLMPDVWGPFLTPGIRADVNRNWATELTPYINRDAKSMDLADFFPGVLREFRVNGKQYSLPFQVWQDYFFYNPDLFAQAGLAPPPMDPNDKSWNWDKMVLNAQKLAKYDSKGAVKTTGIEFQRDLGSPPAHMHMWGAEPYSAEALRSSVPQKVVWDSPEAVNALTKAHDLIYKYKLTTPTDVWSNFESGKAGQQIKSGWHILYINQNPKAKWAIRNLPWGTTNRGTMWPDGWRISRVCKNKEQAWDFIKFLCSKKTLSYLSSDPKSPYLTVPMSRKSVFLDNFGENISKVTGMKAADVYRIHSQCDEVNVVKFQETICIHLDLVPFLDPIMADLWNNRLSPAQAAAKLQDVTNRRLPDLFKRWVRNIKFTGREAD